MLGLLRLLLGLMLSRGSPRRGAVHRAWRAESTPCMRRTYPYANANANARIAPV